MTMVFAMLDQIPRLAAVSGDHAVLLIGLVLGLINGVLTAYLRIPSFITTLAALSAFRGVAFMFNNGSPIFQLLAGSSRSSTARFSEYRCRSSMSSISMGCAYCVALHRLGRAHLRGRRQCRMRRGFPASTSAARSSLRSSSRADGGLGAVLMAARLNSGSPNYGVGHRSFRRSPLP